MHEPGVELMSDPAKPRQLKAKSDLARRVSSGLVLGSVALLTTWTGGVVSLAAFLVLGLFVLVEWERLTGQSSPRRLLFGVAIVCVAAAIAHWVGPVSGASFATALLFVALGTALLEVKGRWSATGIAYASWLVVSLVSLRGHDAIGLSAIFLVFAAVWATDSAAFFVGKSLKGPKLLPAISPNKTWSGAIAGVLAAVIISVLYIVWADGWVSSGALWLDEDPGQFSAQPSIATLIYLGLLAFALSVAAQIGDLVESALKRKFGAKDSGKILPGHGGVMDRVDGLVFASCLAFLIGLSAKGDGTVSEGLFAFGALFLQIV
ncbi:MAG: phosphatidate cytidylyltransferase [Pseudomonadota bacterium]